MRFATQLARWGNKPAAAMTDAAARLSEEAEAANLLRGLHQDPNVRALQIERAGRRAQAGLLVVMALGLLYTTQNVAVFFGGALGYLIEPVVVSAMLILMWAEQVYRREGVRSGAWVLAARWAAFVFTLTFNVWTSLATLDKAGIAKHIAIPVMVFLIAEGLIQVLDRMTEAARRRAVGPGVQASPDQSGPQSDQGSEGSDPRSSGNTEEASSDKQEEGAEDSSTDPEDNVIPLKGSDEDLLVQLRKVVRSSGVPSREWVRTTYGIGTKRAQRLRDQVRAEQAEEMAQ